MAVGPVCFQLFEDLLNSSAWINFSSGSVSPLKQWQRVPFLSPSKQAYMTILAVFLCFAVRTDSVFCYAATLLDWRNVFFFLPFPQEQLFKLDWVCFTPHLPVSKRNNLTVNLLLHPLSKSFRVVPRSDAQRETPSRVEQRCVAYPRHGSETLRRFLHPSVTFTHSCEQAPDNRLSSLLLPHTAFYFPLPFIFPVLLGSSKCSCLFVCLFFYDGCVRVYMSSNMPNDFFFSFFFLMHCPRKIAPEAAFWEEKKRKSSLY